VIWRSEARPFRKRQIELLETFASQAAIAAEKVRLLGEVLARTRELSAALHEKMATAEILSLKIRRVTLLQEVAVAANEAATIEAPLQIRLQAVCAYAGWPVGPVYLVQRTAARAVLVSAPLRHLGDPELFAHVGDVADAVAETFRCAPRQPGPGQCRAGVGSRRHAGPDHHSCPPPRGNSRPGRVRIPVLVGGTEVAAALEILSPEAA
jgi:hypothetical protein